MRSYKAPASQLSFFEGDWPFNAPPAITRPIHYLGSKLRIVNQICELLDRLDSTYGPACDLFAGSGTVAKALSLKRNVIAVDIQEYSRVLCSAILNPAECNSALIEEFCYRAASSEHFRAISWAFEPLINFEKKALALASTGNLGPLCSLLENGSILAFDGGTRCPSSFPMLSPMKEAVSRLHEVQLIDSPRSLVSRYFGGVYFSYSQACELDALLEAAANLPDRQKDTFLAALLSTASEIVNTIGKQFAQPIRPRSASGEPKPLLFELVSRDRLTEVMAVYKSWLKRYAAIPRTGKAHEALRQDYREALKTLKGKVMIVYADPPYTRDHYSRYYHVLETICLRDNPKISTVREKGKVNKSRGIYRVDRHQSPFCIYSKAPTAFSDLIAGVKSLDVPLVLSYSPYEKDNGSRPRLMTIKQIEDIAKSYFRRVEIHRAGRISHSKLTSSQNTSGLSYEAEILFVCEP